MEKTEIELKKLANELRKDVIETVYAVKDGHPGPALGIADIISVLYFDEMNINPENPDWEDRDRFILSKGHSCPIVYAALAKKGFFKKEELKTLRNYGSILQGHPSIDTPGIDITSGSLGNGIAIGLGMDVARKYLNKDYYSYVIVGDGELNEGVIWEAVIAAKKNKASNLITFVDVNGFQSGGAVKDISALDAISDNFKSFGWHVQDIDGNDIQQIRAAISTAKKEKSLPSAIICSTVKGKGVSFMENDNKWHKGVPTDEQYIQAIKELEVEA